MIKAPFSGFNLARYGFDNSRLSFGLRTALASCLALLLAWLIGLEHPQWAAMTVWAVSQPVRGMLVEKSFFRALGTVIGTLFGVLLVVYTGDNLLLMVICLSLWVGLCVGAGNALSGLISYGTLLSGYSATMVALLDTQGAAGGILLLGIDRLLTVLMGVLVALVIGLLFTPRHAEEELTGRVRRGTASILRGMAARFSGTSVGDRTTTHQLLQDTAITEQLLEPNAAGSLRSHRTVRALRAIIQAQVASIFWIKNSRNLPERESVAITLTRAADALDAGAAGSAVLSHLERALAQCKDDNISAEVIRQLLDSLRERYALGSGTDEVPPINNKIALHRDWAGARHASYRATGLLLIVGLLWIYTGWEVGAYVMLGTSVMISLFSTFETPSHIMGHIFFWQLLGAVAALACHWLIWPLATQEWQMVFMLMPFMLLIIPLYAHRRFMLGSMDYIMVLLLLSHPAYPLSTSFPHSISIALAVVSGPLLAYIAFKVVLPADARRRRLQLTDMMINELTTLAASQKPSVRQSVWQARLYHRVLKLVQSVSRTGEPLQSAARGSLAVLAVGNAIIGLHDLVADKTLPPGTLRDAQAALQRTRQLRQNPAKTAQSLRVLASHLWHAGHPLAWDIENAALNLDDNVAFFRSGSLEA